LVEVRAAVREARAVRVGARMYLVEKGSELQEGRF
jgi:hypothetical protein